MRPLETACWWMCRAASRSAISYLSSGAKRSWKMKWGWLWRFSWYFNVPAPHHCSIGQTGTQTPQSQSVTAHRRPELMSLFVKFLCAFWLKLLKGLNLKNLKYLANLSLTILFCLPQIFPLKKSRRKVEEFLFLFLLHIKVKITCSPPLPQKVIVDNQVAQKS